MRALMRPRRALLSFSRRVAPASSISLFDFSRCSSSTASKANFPTDGSFGRWIKQNQRGSVFGRFAEEYDAHRPHYPDAAFNRIFAATPPGPIRAVDIATGTGRGAFRLALHGNGKKCEEVLASDTDAGMITTARAAKTSKPFSEAVSFIVSPAETLSKALLSSDSPNHTLGTRRFHLATVFQAWHWFDSEAVLEDLHTNLLVPGGILAVVWNDRDLSVPWVSEFESLIESYNPDYDRKVRQCDAFGPSLTANGCFTLLSQTDDANSLFLASTAALFNLTETLSYIRNVLDQDNEEDKWQSWRRDLEALVSHHHSNSNSAGFHLPLKTRVYILRAN